MRWRPPSQVPRLRRPPGRLAPEGGPTAALRPWLCVDSGGVINTAPTCRKGSTLSTIGSREDRGSTARSDDFDGHPPFAGWTRRGGGGPTGFLFRASPRGQGRRRGSPHSPAARLPVRIPSRRRLLRRTHHAPRHRPLRPAAEVRVRRREHRGHHAAHTGIDAASLTYVMQLDTDVRVLPSSPHLTAAARRGRRRRSRGPGRARGGCGGPITTALVGARRGPMAVEVSGVSSKVVGGRSPRSQSSSD